MVNEKENSFSPIKFLNAALPNANQLNNDHCHYVLRVCNAQGYNNFAVWWSGKLRRHSLLEHTGTHLLLVQQVKQISKIYLHRSAG